MTVSEVERAQWAGKALAAIKQGGDLNLFQRLADSLDEGVFVVDAERNIVLFNQKAEKITGFSRQEVIGRHCLAGIRCAHCLESCGIFDRGEVRGVALQLFRSDGEAVEVIKDATAIRDDDGQILGAIEIIRQPEQQTEDLEHAQSRSSMEMLETLMGTLGRGFLILDEAFVIRHASATFTRQAESSLDALRNLPAARVLGDDLCAQESPFRKGLANGQRREGWRAQMPLANGKNQPVSVTGAPLEPGALSCGSGSGGRYLILVRSETRIDDPSTEIVEFEGMVARSPAMHRTFQLIDHLHDSDASVLITGESGTGKELVARAIHARSTRANRPFVAVNCGALPVDLLESELFGHARGAFTGAVRDKAGRFEVARDGTIFLDEVGDMPLALQVKLLRVLQERTFERVGETKSRASLARVVAATHQDLTELVRQRRFRDDLFYRLNVVPISLPPLRERMQDLDLLIDHLLEKIGSRRSRALRLSPSAMRVLLSHSWPGNVRQLENALEYATAVCEGQTIHKEDLPAELIDGPAAAAATSAPVESAIFPTASDIHAALRAAQGRRGKAAQILGVSRTTLWRRIKELNLA